MMHKILYRLKYRYGRYLNLKKPVDISLELASVCNARCEYCYHGDQDNLPFSKGQMKLETAHKIIRQGADLGVNSIKFNWRGESTINPHFGAITSYAKNLAKGSTYIDRISNSNFKFALNREDVFLGFCNQTKVKVSFDSFKPLVFEQQRKGINHSQVLNNIDYFYNHPKRKDTELVIQAVRTNLNMNEDLEFEVKRRWREASVSIRDMVGGRTEKDIESLENKKRDDSQRQSCLQAFVRLIFDHEGNSTFCCPDIKNEIYLGNIHSDNMSTIFNSTTAEWLRLGIKSGGQFSYEPCKSCSSFESYKGYKHPWKS